jgi:hypothetical protein
MSVMTAAVATRIAAAVTGAAAVTAAAAITMEVTTAVKNNLSRDFDCISTLG